MCIHDRVMPKLAMDMIINESYVLITASVRPRTIKRIQVIVTSVWPLSQDFCR